MSVAAFTVFFCALFVGAFLCLYRLQQGPTPPDRMVAVDILGTLLVGFCALYALTSGADFYLNLAMAWALLSFVGTIALAKYLGGQKFDE
jgi:multicomponent Na+:H+ antiporter subunit F